MDMRCFIMSAVDQMTVIELVINVHEHSLQNNNYLHSHIDSHIKTFSGSDFSCFAYTKIIDISLSV